MGDAPPQDGNGVRPIQKTYPKDFDGSEEAVPVFTHKEKYLSNGLWQIELRQTI